MRPNTTQIIAAETTILITDGTGVNNFYYILEPHINKSPITFGISANALINMW